MSKKENELLLLLEACIAAQEALALYKRLTLQMRLPDAEQSAYIHERHLLIIQAICKANERD